MGLGHFPVLCQTPSLSPALRVNMVPWSNCPVAMGSVWAGGCRGVRIKCPGETFPQSRHRLKQVPGVVCRSNGLLTFLMSALLFIICGYGQVLSLPWLHWKVFLPSR